MKKAILFDFGQTLADSADGFRYAEKEAQLELFSYLGAASRDKFLSTYRSIRKSFHDRSVFSRKAMWKIVCHEHGVSPDHLFLEQTESRYWETVEEKTSLFPETMQVIEQLSKRFRLGLVTNTQGKLSGAHRIARFPFLEHTFEKIIVAGESGIPPKPHSAPFHLCLEALAISPLEAIYVGDDPRIDVLGAKSAGIDPIWIKHRSIVRSWPDIEVHCPIIFSLDELPGLDILSPNF